MIHTPPIVRLIRCLRLLPPPHRLYHCRHAPEGRTTETYVNDQETIMIDLGKVTVETKTQAPLTSFDSGTIRGFKA
jgi:hypothetical protein